MNQAWTNSLKIISISPCCNLTAPLVNLGIITFAILFLVCIGTTVSKVQGLQLFVSLNLVYNCTTCAYIHELCEIQNQHLSASNNLPYTSCPPSTTYSPYFQACFRTRGPVNNSWYLGSLRQITQWCDTIFTFSSEQELYDITCTEFDSEAFLFDNVSARLHVRSANIHGVAVRFRKMVRVVWEGGGGDIETDVFEGES